MRKTLCNWIIATIIAALFVYATACSKQAPKETPKPQTAQSQPVTPPPTGEAEKGRVVMKKWTGDLDGMIERRQIRVLTVYSKTNYFVDRGTQRGMTYEAFQMFENELNKKLKKKNVRVLVTFLPVRHDELIPALVEGRGDIVAAGELITDWRREKVDFTDPIASNVSIIPVTGPGSAPLNSVEDLGGREVYLRASGVGPNDLERFNARLAKAGKPPVKIRPANEVLADEDVLEMVNAGLVDTTISYGYLAEFWKQVFPDLVLNKAAALRSDGKVAWMIRKNSPQLLAELNALVAKYPEGSWQRNELLQRYLKNTKYARQATSNSEIAKFQSVVGFLRKYSDKYNLDYLLMAAQGYQESGLDQNAKSHVGAIGVMQLMPATGNDMKVGDITQLEPNVHAGVKYFRFMVDQYYSNEPMDTFNKGLFTFAAYNAGPGKVKQLRSIAEQRGLNPNVWFNNVELIAAEKIGRETVQYVSNICKYYLAYKMIVERDQERKKAKSQVGKS